MTFKKTIEKYKQFIQDRGIDCLIHFTPTKNLYSILENKKIMSREMLESLDIEQFDILDYAQFTDNIRYDDKSYINLSIAFPNTFLFNRFRERTKDNPTITWCVLKINPIYLYVDGTLFSVTNAASSSSKNQFGISDDLEKLKMLFADELIINAFNGPRRVVRNNLDSKYPTDIQAEVLVKDEISMEHIDQVCFLTEEDLAEAKAAMNCFDTSKFVVDQYYFKSTRNR